MTITFKEKSFLHDIPDQWIYKYYLKDNLDLNGRRIRIKSIFTNERTPSMFLYVRDGKYMWKDYSSGKGGDALDLVTEWLNSGTTKKATVGEVAQMIRLDYKAWKNNNGEFVDRKLETEYIDYALIKQIGLREYQEHDIRYWEQYGISQTLLETYNVVPLKYFKLGKLINGEPKWNKSVYDFNSYGFYENSGELIKIYNPYKSDFKHISFKKEVLGREQLDTEIPVLIIASSMKDLLTIKALGLEVEVIAPISEMTLIPVSDIDYLKELFPTILTLFDNDRTGIRSMMMYKAIYDIDFVYISKAKDISELRQMSDKHYVQHELIKAINKKINKEHEISNNSQTNGSSGFTYDEKKGHRHPY